MTRMLLAAFTTITMLGGTACNTLPLEAEVDEVGAALETAAAEAEPGDPVDPPVPDPIDPAPPVILPLIADLKFNPPFVVIHPTVGAAIPLPPGGLAELPCNATAFRVHYYYRNGGGALAPGHVNRSWISFFPPVTHPMPALAALQSTSGWFSHAAPLVANAHYSYAIDLDAVGNLVTPELSETNNRFLARIVRRCP
jgi:hypothetical protein